MVRAWAVQCAGSADPERRGAVRPEEGLGFQETDSSPGRCLGMRDLIRVRVGKLIVLYDSNNISIEGNTDIAFREDVAKRYGAYGWQVLKVSDGNDIAYIEAYL